jgi:hypothetical protein
MSSRKRAHASSTPSPSAAKQPRVGEGTRATPVTAPRPHGRVVLNVGGQVFQSSRTTLEGSSSYFRSLLSRWDEDAEEPVFIDCDADAFGVLLSHMRIASNIILPKDEEELGARVLLLAEYLGMESLLAQVKAKAYRNMHPDQEEKNDGDDLAAAFDAEVGTLQQAIDSKVLPARFFAPAPKPPPKRVIKNLIPAPPGYTALFSDDKFLDGVAKVQDEDGEEYNADCVSRDVLSFAVVELQDGTTGVEAIVQRSLQSTTVEYERAINHTDVDTHQQLHHHLQFASEVDWEHYLIVPPPASARMLPVAPASIRATFAKPAITRADTGKRVTVSENGNAVIVDGEVRSVTWGARKPPVGIKDRVIAGYYTGDARHQMMWVDRDYTQVPYLTGASNQITRDVAFVEMGRGDAEGTVPTKFYIADSDGKQCAHDSVLQDNRLIDVTRMTLPGG